MCFNSWIKFSSIIINEIKPYGIYRIFLSILTKKLITYSGARQIKFQYGILEIRPLVELFSAYVLKMLRKEWLIDDTLIKMLRVSQPLSVNIPDIDLKPFP